MSRLTKNNSTSPAGDEADRGGRIEASTRCDRCGAAAFVIVYLRISESLPKGGLLAFCAHHYQAHQPGLVKYVSRVRDERHRLTPAN